MMLNLLIVDDASINRYVLHRYIDKILKNVNIQESNSGKKVLEGVCDYDIILMDIKMPDMNGDEVAKQLRERGFQGVIIGITGQVEITPSIIKEGFMDDCIDKPVNIQELKTRLCKFVKTKYFI